MTRHSSKSSHEASKKNVVSLHYKWIHCQARVHWGGVPLNWPTLETTPTVRAHPERPKDQLTSETWS